MTKDNWVVEATETILNDARFNDQGLMPVVAQDATSREVLMVAWMDLTALAQTLSEGRVTYYSRSRQEYWRKGDTSGHTQHATSAVLDCDGDVLLLQVHQVGPACHTGARSCFTQRSES